MKRIFSPGEENTAARYEYRARFLTLLRRKRHSSQLSDKALKDENNLQSFQCVLMSFRQCRENLVVFTPQHFPLLAKIQNTGAETIPLIDEHGYSR